MIRFLRRLVTSPCEQLITTGRVRMRQLICIGCRCRTWVVVGSPRCPTCAGGAAPAERPRANPR